MMITIVMMMISEEIVMVVVIVMAVSVVCCRRCCCRCRCCTEITYISVCCRCCRRRRRAGSCGCRLARLARLTLLFLLAAAVRVRVVAFVRAHDTVYRAHRWQLLFRTYALRFKSFIDLITLVIVLVKIRFELETKLHFFSTPNVLEIIYELIVK